MLKKGICFKHTYHENKIFFSNKNLQAKYVEIMKPGRIEGRIDNILIT